MRINLLSDKLPDQGDFNRSLARAHSKKCLIPKTDDFSKFYDWSEDELRRNVKLRYHVSLIKEALAMQDRRYLFFSLRGDVETCNIFHDSHIEIEKLGAQQYFTGSCVIVTMENHLDIALQKCCGADPNRIRKIRDYKNMSFLFMNCALHAGNEPVYVNRFRGYDREVDTYLDSCFVKPAIQNEMTAEDETGESLAVLRKIYYGVLEAGTSILLNCVRALCGKYELAIRSQSFSTFVLSPQKKEMAIPDHIDYTDKDVSFMLPIITVKKWEYTDTLIKQ